MARKRIGEILLEKGVISRHQLEAALMIQKQTRARLGITLAYVLTTLLFVAGLAFLLSVSTDSPLGAVGGAVGLAIISSILDAVTALGRFREILPTHWQYSWLSALQPQMSWDPMIEGAVVPASYAVVLLALAFRRFQHKDIVS